MDRSFFLGAALWCFGLLGCRPAEETRQGNTVTPSIILRGAADAPIPFPIVDDNVKHDTLLVQVTLDMGDGTYMMVASNIEETFEGLRLYRYRANADSSADVLAISSAAYDSWTMLPTCFGTSDSSRFWVLANFGEKQSWGQKLMQLDTAFHDIGFLEVTLPTRTIETDTAYLKRENIAPFTRVNSSADTTVFTFVCDSVHLYDDLQGNNDLIVPASALRYTFHTSEGLVLWLHGHKLPVKEPS